MGIIIDRMGIGKFGTEGGDIMDFYGVCILILVLYGIGLLIGLIQAAANSRAREFSVLLSFSPLPLFFFRAAPAQFGRASALWEQRVAGSNPVTPTNETAGGRA